jgi:hypothetical protein
MFKLSATDKLQDGGTHFATLLCGRGRGPEVGLRCASSHVHAAERSTIEKSRKGLLRIETARKPAKSSE